MQLARSIPGLAIVIIAVSFIGTSCAPATGSKSSVAANVAIVSVTPTATTAKALRPAGARALFGTKTGFTNVPAPTTGHYIISGSPDYLKVTLTKIALNGAFSDGTGTAVAWTGSKVLTLDGITPIDTSGMALTITTGTVTDVVLTFDPTGSIKGSLTGDLFTGPNLTGLVSPVTVYTKAAYAYNDITNTGGASSYTSFTTSPSEEAPVTINLAAGGGSVVVDTPASLTIAAGDSPALTILVDLSRMLRFYSGGNTSHQGGVNPSDPSNMAYFFSHTVFSHSIAAFFGTPGTIQGYSAVYAEYPASAPNYPAASVSGAVNGWMTLIFAPDGSILSGILSQDDDNDLVVGKGWFGPFASTGGVFTDLVYSLPPSSYNLRNFMPGTAKGDDGYFDWDTTAMAGAYGEVEYSLAFTH